MSTPEPRRIARLPRDRIGRPVPWFVTWMIDGQPVPLGTRGAEPEFRVVVEGRRERAVAERRCWVCGGVAGNPAGHSSFVIGPMCAVNRTSAEPPCHLDCATWSAQNCPFLTRPQMTRRERGLPEALAESPGVMIARNPGVTLVWVSAGWQPFSDGRGGWLVDIGEPASVAWYAHGRAATRAEVLASIDSGLPALREMAPDPAALAELEARHGEALALVPA